MPDELNVAYHAATQSVITPTKQRVVSNWENLMLNGLTQAAIQTFTDVSGPLGIAMQNAVANLTSAFLANRTGQKALVPDSKVLGRNTFPATQQDAVSEWADTYARPFVQARSLVKNGMTLEDAVHRTAIRIAQMVDTDAQMSKLRQAHESLRHYGATEYKRVNHPEASKTGTCPLCLLASTQVYYTEDLMPIHTGCQCDVDLIQPGDITRINGRRYVGLSSLRIPEELMHIGERADPNSARSRIAGYLQDMDKRQFHVITEAWAQTVDVGYHPEIGPVLALKTKVLNYDPNLPKPVHTVTIDPEKQPKLDVSQPVELSNLTDDEYGSGVQHINETIYETWSNVTFDEDKFEMRAGAQDAEWHGYQGMTQEQFDAINHVGVTDNMYQLYGKEIVAKAAWGDTTEDTLYRGIQLTFDDADTLKVWEGKEISMPLSSFTDVQGQGKNFATGRGWVSEDVPNGPTEPVVFELAPGARAAPIAFNLGEEPDEYVSFGRFKVVGVTQDHDALHVQIEQTSMIEAQPLNLAAQKSISEVGFIDPDFYRRASELGPDAGKQDFLRLEAPPDEPRGILAPAITEDTDLHTAIRLFGEHWPNVEVLGFDPKLDWEYLQSPQSQVIARDFLQGMDEVFMRFPAAADKVDALIIDTPLGGEGPFGQTVPSMKWGKTDMVYLSEDWLREPEKMQRQFEAEDRGHGFSANCSQRPGYYTAVHEGAHVIDIAAGFPTNYEPETGSTLEQAVMEAYAATTGNENPALSSATDWRTPDFDKWWHEQFSAYSENDYLQAGSMLDSTEAVAEAFADVMVNGDSATVGSKVVYNWLLDVAAGSDIIPIGQWEALRLVIPELEGAA